MWDKIGQILYPILLGVFLAYLMEPVTSWFQERYENHFLIFHKKARVCRIVSVLSCFLFFLSIFFLVISLFSMNLFYYFQDVSWEEFLNKISQVFQPIVDFLTSLGNNEKTSPYSDMVRSMAEGKLNHLLKHFMESTLSLPKFLGRFFIGMIIALYLLIDKEIFLSYARKLGEMFLSERKREQIFKIWQEFQRVFSGYLKGQAMDAFVMGCLLSTGLGLLRVPLGISIGILAGIGNLVPYLGPFIAYVLTIFFCLLEGKQKTMWVALFYLLTIQQVDGSYIGPKLLGKQIQMKPVFIVIAVLIGGTFFGPIGMILAVPFAGLLKSLCQLLSRREFS